MGKGSVKSVDRIPEDIEVHYMESKNP